MAKVESFSLNHDLVKAPYVRLAGSETQQDVTIEKYDLRFLQPNADALPTAALHTLEHLLATQMRDELTGIIDISPMGCRTGFYMIVWGQHDIKEIRDALYNTLVFVTKTDFVPAVAREACGNYRDHSLFSAKEYAQQVLDQGISLDPFQRIL